MQLVDEHPGPNPGFDERKEEFSTTHFVDHNDNASSTMWFKKFRKRLRNLWMAHIGADEEGHYAHRNLPKITMETLSATGFNVILLLTYLSFAASITIYFFLNSGSKQVLKMNGAACSSNTSCKISSDYGVTISCSIDGPGNQTTFYGNISQLVNLIGDIELAVYIPAAIFANISISEYIEADLHLKGCTTKNIDECTYTDVLNLSQNIGLKETVNDGGDKLYRGILFDTFQNQEILQNNGIIEAYHVEVAYPNNRGIVGSEDVSYYEFHYYAVYEKTLTKVLQCVLCGFTVVYSIMWYSALFQDEPNPFKWLRERRWLSWFLFGLLLFQNPVFCIAQWYVDVKNVTGGVAYASAIVGFTGQTIIFTMFLLFADGLAKGMTCGFYFPKLSFAVVMLVMYACMISINYPSIFDPERPSIQAVMNWPRHLQQRYATFGCVMCVLILYWIVYFLFGTISTGIKLQKIPYVKARQQHLSYRFFLLQAVLVGAVVVFEYVIEISDLLASGIDDKVTLEDLANDLDAIFNSENQSIAWTLFISVYVYLAVYLYFPVSGANLHYFLSRSFVLREEDIDTAKEIRVQDLKRLKKYGLIIPKFVERKPIFCVERARWMAELSYQAYFDPPEKPEVPGLRTLGPINVEKFGFDILEFIWDQQHETNCFVMRHKAMKKLVVVFRGSMAKEHWADNLKLHLRAIDLHTLCPRGCEKDQPVMLQENLDEYMVHLEKGPSKKFLRRVRENVQKLPGQVYDAGQTGVELLLDGLETTADVTRLNRIPGLKHVLVGYVHTGFWDAYASVRERLHRVIRKYLMEEEYQLFVTGHSLGGALASLASMDLSVHTLPLVNAVWANRRGLAPHADFEGRCSIVMYNFGSPRVGNNVFRKAYNRLVPHSFRVVVDGDIVTGIPPRTFYQHLGTEVIIDGDGGGNFIVDPSVVEKKFQARPRANAIVHHLDYYNKGIRGILSEDMDKEILEDLVKPPIDEVPNQEDESGIWHSITFTIGNMFGLKGSKTNSQEEIQTDPNQEPLSETLL